MICELLRKKRKKHRTDCPELQTFLSKKEKSSDRNIPTTYIYGKHPNSNCDKEFMWRVPKSMTWFSENVQVGDSLLCQTKFGIAPVIVTKIEVLDKCPVDFRVKKVAKCMIRRDGYTVEP